MMLEWYWAATASVLEEAKPLGFHREVARYKASWRRNAGAWRPHLESSRRMILQAAGETSRRDLVVVAGSGWCLDIPLEELSRIFKNVLLLDVVHPKELRNRAAHLGNVELMRIDLTGCLKTVARAAETRSRLDIRPRHAGLPGGQPPDLAISANTLSYLPLLPIERLWATGLYSDQELEGLAEDMIATHLAWLDSLKGVRCLLADHAWLGISDEESLAADPLHGVSLPATCERWNWNYAPKPEAHPLRDVVHIVGCSIY